MYRICLVGIGSYRRNYDEDWGYEARYEGHDAHLERSVGSAMRSWKEEIGSIEGPFIDDMYREKNRGFI